ncbi:exopolygalacturonase clone GBGA483-like [Mercurialis annua]|uniref:exopolygalacturonase clone GBGA483-like n=1 Tax=Mercurialis annua TaxID=3986 RepID=UPI00215E4BE0|nr:exopolygalacturonase clone GBGA483-like [Mercurialis annua]
MDNSKMLAGATCLLFLLLLITKAQGVKRFDVKKYGAKADGKTDDSEAIKSAWKDACESKLASTVVIGKGKYMVGPLKFKGPCKNPITIQVHGNIKAPVDIERFVSQDGWIVFKNINGLQVLGSGSFDGQGSIHWSKTNCVKKGKCSSLPSNIRFTKLSNTKIQDITSLNSKLYHMTVLNCNNITLENVVINAPEKSLNTDGIHIGRSNEVKIIGAKIKTGDECVSIGEGSQQVAIEKVHCGPGHGISIGSLGRYHDEQPVNGVKVKNCTLTNTSNGLRIKTWPASPTGIASNLHFEDIIMDNVSNPVHIDQQYCPYNKCQAKIPSRVKIHSVSFKNIRGTSATKLAVKLNCSKGMPCQNVSIGNINLKYSVNGKQQGKSTSECVNVKPRIIGKMVPPGCAKSA